MEKYFPSCNRPPGLLAMHRRECCPGCFRVRPTSEHLSFRVFLCSYCGYCCPVETVMVAHICITCLPACRFYPIVLNNLAMTGVQDNFACDNCGLPVGHDEGLCIDQL